MKRTFEGKVGIVTGASSGIGRATAEALAAAGAAVVLAARREAKLAELADGIRDAGGRAEVVATDVSSAEDVERMVAHAVAAFGRLDCAVNAAGIEGALAPLVELSEADWDRVLDINLKGTFLCVQHEARAMLGAGNGGSIVNVGSVNSFLGGPYVAAYAASKHGQVGLTSSASAELASQGIRVNLVCPGMIDTPMHQRVRERFGDEMFDAAFATRVHSRRVGQPEEIARLIVFLCSDDASFVTGAALTADGGLLGTT
jgi:NAD(P)-dependent dehydrogenase (short-subunit alcohol dehydrogenase family)